MSRYAKFTIVLPLFGFLALFFFLSSARSIIRISRIAGENSHAVPLAYHFAFFLPEEKSVFFNEIAHGAVRAASRHNAALSFHPVGNGSQDLKMAKFSGIDGLAIYPSTNESNIRHILNGVSRVGIAVAIVEHSISDDDAPWPFVGTNSFDIGRKIGEILDSSQHDTVKAAIVYSEKSPGIHAEKDLVGLGINSVLGNKLQTPLTILRTNLNPLDAEELTYGILKNHPEIETIVYTDPRDTLAATQVLIDMNLVGTVRLIGFGKDKAILDYVEKGILSATVVTNPEKIGESAIEMLVEMKQIGNATGYIDTGVQLVTLQNLQEYRQKKDFK